MDAISQNRLVLLSRNIFTATGDTQFDGFIAIEGNKIAAVGSREEAGRWTDGAQVVDLGEKLVTPGFVDVHTFFSGGVLRSLGVPLHLPANLRSKVVTAQAGQAQAAIESEADRVQMTAPLSPSDACASLREQWQASPRAPRPAP